MSDADSFIHEVTEEVRRDRMFRLWRRFGPFVIGGLVAVVGATAVVQWLGHVRESAAREAGRALIAAARAPSAADRAAAYAGAAESLDAGPAVVARLGAAAALAESGARAEAVAAYRAVAEDSAAPMPIAQFALLRAATLDSPDAGAQATVDALAPLTGADSAFRLLALEARGAARLEAGDQAGARADFEAMLNDPVATEPTRERARALLGLFGETG